MTITTQDDPETLEDETEITAEHHYYPFGLSHTGPWYANVAPENKYRYNRKEWNEDFGLNMYDYGARGYMPDLGRWGGVDALAERYYSWSPYNYVMGNPIRNIDPDGRGVETEIFDQKGKKVGEDSKGKDGNVSIVNKEVAKELKKGTISPPEAIEKSNIQTTRVVLEESMKVLDRTYENGGLNEEVSVITPEGKVIRGKKGPSHISGGLKSADVPIVDGLENTLIHSHITGFEEFNNQHYGSDATEPSNADKEVFKRFRQNIIVGKLGPPKTDRGEPIPRSDGAVFFDRNAKRQGLLTDKATRKIIKN
ncbi:MAG: RHS repeat-associated core domain-containing protein, partial [Saprospiraceae bacterium]|nr:RHS repeat-associated core domain-containing protein [Saprospiraceae bacterium]